MRGPRITPHQLSIFTEPILNIYRALESDIYNAIAKRLITSKDYGSDLVLRWQVDKMNELRILNDETIRRLSQATGVAEGRITDVVNDVGYKTIQGVDDELSSIRPNPPPVTDLDLRLESYVNQTFREFDNYVNQTLLTTNFGRGEVARQYQRIVEETTAKVLSSQTTINKAVAETVIKWQKGGIKTAFVDKGGHTWGLEHYARTVLRSTVNRTYNDLRLSRMDEHDVEFVLVNSLPDARDACSRIQGNVASMKEVSSDPQYPSIYDFGYGEPDGIRGINCRHILYPFIPGVNFNNEVQYDPEEARERGEIVQGQRNRERVIRDAKKSLRVAETVGDDDTINKYKKQVRNRQANLREYISEHNLPRHYDRERIFGMTESPLTESVRETIQKQNEARDNVRKEIQNGTITKTVNAEKQARHMAGSQSFENYRKKLSEDGRYGPSYVTISHEEAQDLVNRYAGTGNIQLTRHNTFANKELITHHNGEIGYYISEDGEEIFTNVFDIRYSKTGTHIFPAKGD